MSRRMVEVCTCDLCGQDNERMTSFTLKDFESGEIVNKDLCRRCLQTVKNLSCPPGFLPPLDDSDRKSWVDRIETRVDNWNDHSGKEDIQFVRSIVQFLKGETT